MKSFFWLLLKAAIFFLLFAFAIGNRHEAVLYFLPGQALTLPMVLVVLGFFAMRVFLGMLVMVPRWWQWRCAARKAAQQQAPAVATESASQPDVSVAHPAELARHMTDASITIPYEP